MLDIYPGFGEKPGVDYRYGSLRIERKTVEFSITAATPVFLGPAKSQHGLQLAVEDVQSAHVAVGLLDLREEVKNQILLDLMPPGYYN